MVTYRKYPCCMLLCLLYVASSQATAASSVPGQRPLHIKDSTHVLDARPNPAGLQFVARQSLFDYGVQEGLRILLQRIYDFPIADVTQSFDLPLVGKFTVQLSDIHIVSFDVSLDTTSLTIDGDVFSAKASGVFGELAFKWHWEKMGLTGTGTGAVHLTNGSLATVFGVHMSKAGHPEVQVGDASCTFDNVNVSIRSKASNWLYQALLWIVGDDITGAVQAAVVGALTGPVPDQVNGVLAGLPSAVTVRGLPFDASFLYSVYTLDYVLLQGFGLVEPHPGSVTQCSDSFPPSQPPVPRDMLRSDPHMSSIYLSDAVANCMLWGVYDAGLLRTQLDNSSLPGLHLTTDLLAGLLPDMARSFPHQPVSMTMEAARAPRVTFNASEAGGVLLDVQHLVRVLVRNDTYPTSRDGYVFIASLLCNLTVSADVSWNSTLIRSVTAHHSVEQASVSVSPALWDLTVTWAIKTYGGQYSAAWLIHTYVRSPVVSQVSVLHPASATYPGWYGFSTDVALIRGRGRAAAQSSEQQQQQQHQGEQGPGLQLLQRVRAADEWARAHSADLEAVHQL